LPPKPYVGQIYRNDEAQPVWTSPGSFASAAAAYAAADRQREKLEDTDLKARALAKKPPKRPRDPNQLAKFVADIATGEHHDGPSAAVVARARKAGVKGGPARAMSLTPEQRSEIARAAASARWKKGD
jgi:hypothetical protein